jgi:hypothetical protein
MARGSGEGRASDQTHRGRFEASRDGVWLARWLSARDIEAHVIHALSPRNQVGHLTSSEKNGGSLFAADPEQVFDQQSIFWAPEALSTVLSLRQFGAASDAGQQALDVTRLSDGELRRGPDGWHGVVVLAGAKHRLFLSAMPATGAPLSIELPLDASSDLRLQAAHRFWCAIEGRRLGASPLALSPGVGGVSFR